ncbi:MAG: Hpt domain-containing protein, partial [Gemmatimonadales bacterium]|nr:Hpt domain-containing protein [Gemmatimonadales bacterium]
MDVSRYAALFLTESREHLRACNQCLLEWEREPGASEPVDGLFRSIHTIKGMAATMGYDGVALLSHRSENLLDALRTGRIAVSADVLQLLFSAVDAIADGIERTANGETAPAQDALLAELDHAAAGAGAGMTAELMAVLPRRAIRTISVTVRPGAQMRGGRAVLALRQVEQLGT